MFSFGYCLENCYDHYFLSWDNDKQVSVFHRVAYLSSDYPQSNNIGRYSRQSTAQSFVDRRAFQNTIYIRIFFQYFERRWKDRMLGGHLETSKVWDIAPPPLILTYWHWAVLGGYRWRRYLAMIGELKALCSMIELTSAGGTVMDCSHVRPWPIVNGLGFPTLSVCLCRVNDPMRRRTRRVMGKGNILFQSLAAEVGVILKT